MEESFYKVTHKVACIVGGEAAILYAHLLSLQKNCYNPKGIKEFFQNQNQFLQALPWLNKHSLKKSLKILSGHNMIQISRKGVKNQNYFMVVENEDQWVKNEPTEPTSGHKENPLVGIKRTHEEKTKRKEKGKKEKTQEDPSETVTHERTSEELEQERMDAFLKGEMFDNSMFEETKQKSVIEETKEKKPVTDLSAAMLQFIHEFEY